jgi:uncharacterized membrane protein
MNKKNIQAISDSIFMVVLALLAIDFKPDGLEEKIKILSLSNLLIDIQTSFAIYFLSLIMIAVFWIVHQLIFGLLKKNISRIFVQINILFSGLLLIFPFSSKILSRYNQEQLAWVLYNSNVFVLSLFGLIILFLAYKMNYIDTNIPILKRKEAVIRISISCFLFFIAIIVSHFFKQWSVIILILNFVFNLLPSLFTIHENKPISSS